MCPANIKVHKVKRVVSDECTACLECVQICPEKRTLDIQSSIIKTRVPNWIFGSLIVGIFIAITGLAILTGNWQNKISKDEYQKRFKELESPIYQHYQGRVPEYAPND
jgi:ferredoxin